MTWRYWCYEYALLLDCAQGILLDPLFMMFLSLLLDWKISLAVIKIVFCFPVLSRFTLLKCFLESGEQERKLVPVASLMLMFTCWPWDVWLVLMASLSKSKCVSKSEMQIILHTVIWWVWLAKYKFPHLQLFVLWEIKLWCLFSEKLSTEGQILSQSYCCVSSFTNWFIPRITQSSRRGNTWFSVPKIKQPLDLIFEGSIPSTMLFNCGFSYWIKTEYDDTHVAAY